MEDWQIISLLMFNSSAIILRAHQQSHVTILRTSVIVPEFQEVEGCPIL
jgi:hypothetical protein